MSGSFDVAEALDGGISDRERAWAFIRSFAGAWGDPLTEDDGTPGAELAQAEAVLGCSLPREHSRALPRTSTDRPEFADQRKCR
ncbi:hypothetical protein QNN03_07810 [Streptomyces sp. GXMU-J15]|uniref:Uncharacterized protein n=1 Tax=Streptomyces fuscus TaxID=3048495 RepID=A0ABT7IUS4_9ACTN|nr:hypothetical protein [Streptomyces fuscus]MDL2076342.1 hypothetical protein [Streptomyces fuscus]